MAENKTQPTSASVDAFLAGVEHPTRRADGQRLDRIFREVTGWEPQMWGDSIVGYGRYHYRYDSGREGDFLATGFSPRMKNLVIYIMPGYGNFSNILDRLGRHKLGKSCLYVTRLDNLDEAALRRLIAAGLENLAAKYPVSPS